MTDADSFGTFLETVQAPAPVQFPTIDGEALLVASGLDWQVWVKDGRAWFATRHPAEMSDPTQRVSMSVGDALSAMALGLAELHRQIDEELNGPPPIHPPDAEGEIFRENQVVVLEDMQWRMRSLFQREG